MTESQLGVLVTALLYIGAPIAYISVGVLAYQKVHELSRKYGRVQRQAMVSMVLAIFWTPSIIASEGGVSLGPALVTIFQVLDPPIIAQDLMFAGIAPIAICFLLLFAIRTLLDLDDEGALEHSKEPQDDNRTMGPE